MRVMNASTLPVDVYFVAVGDALPATPTFSSSNLLTLTPPTIFENQTYSGVSIVITPKGERTKFLFNANSNDLVAVAGDDLTLVVPPFNLCAGIDTNRVRVLNAKPGGVDQTIMKDEVLITQLGAAASAYSNINFAGAALDPNSAGGAGVVDFSHTLQAGATRAVNYKTSQTVEVACSNSTSVAGNVIIEFPARGKKYAVTGSGCFTRGNPSVSARVSVELSDLGEYGN